MAFYLELKPPKSRRTGQPPLSPMRSPPTETPYAQYMSPSGMQQLPQDSSYSMYQKPKGSPNPSTHAAATGYTDDTRAGYPGKQKRAQTKVDEPKSFSSAIDNSVKWMICEGIAAPEDKPINLPPPPIYPTAAFNCADATLANSNDSPPGILYDPKILAPRSLNKSVRWRDHEENKKKACYTFCIPDRSALIEVYDESRSVIALERTPTPMDPKFIDDPILSFRLHKLSSDRQLQAEPLRRSGSPHPNARNRPIPMHRAPSPHPINLPGLAFFDDEMTATDDMPPSQNLSPAPPPLALSSRRRHTEHVLRNPSPVPAIRKSKYNNHGTNATMQQQHQHPTRRDVASRGEVIRPPVSGQEPSGSRPQNQHQMHRPHQYQIQGPLQEPTPSRDPPSRDGTTPRDDAPSQQSNQVGPLRRWGTPLGIRRSLSRSRRQASEESVKAEQKRYAEIPSREAQQDAVDEEDDLECRIAEIVWKSKEEPPSPEEKKTRGWNLLKRSSTPQQPRTRRGDPSPGRRPRRRSLSIQRNRSNLSEYDEPDRYQ